MNVARRPWLRAISRTTDLKTTVPSQASIAGPWPKLISTCAGPYSVFEASTTMP